MERTLNSRGDDLHEKHGVKVFKCLSTFIKQIRVSLESSELENEVVTSMFLTVKDINFSLGPVPTTSHH